MYATLILSTLTAISFASPLVKRDAAGVPSSTSTWQPADGYKTTCDTSSDKIIGLTAGPELDTILNDACAAMMAPCAYRERLPKDQACAQITTWPLAAPVENTQSAKIESTEGSEEGGSKLQFTVTPAEKPKESTDLFTGVSWTREECLGYFAHVLVKQYSEGGCHTDKGLGVGKIVAGGDTTLKDTVFEVSIVQAE